MRRLSMLALLFLLLSSCYYRPVYVDGSPPVQPGVGSVPPKIAQQRMSGVQWCREVSRSRCDIGMCKGRGLDLVTLNCHGMQLTRCEIGKGGC